MKAIVLLVFFALQERICICQVIHSPVDIGNEQFGVYGERHTDAFSFLNNPAALCNDSVFSIGIYSARPFMLAELATVGIACDIPFGNSALGVSLVYGGYQAYYESQLSLAYGKRLGRFAVIGIQFNEYAVHVAGYGNYHTVNFSIGGILSFSDQIHFAMQVYNPGSSKLGKAGTEKLAFVYRAGLGYDVSDQVLLAAELIIEEAQRATIRLGISYSMSHKMFLLLGVASAIATPFAGIGLQWKTLRLNLQCKYHSRLGMSSGLGLMFLFGHNKKAES